ncbi:signal transduction histidine kinase /histidine kinase [Rhizobiales bacterium GAS113]|nr:signal transduction histidine kinase /histidine kinase [Rhizobiales bacterium GAS113]
MDDVTQRSFSHVMPDVGALVRVRPGLSAKLLVLTIAFVMLAEILIFIPSVANFRRTWLMNKIAAAATAALVFDAAPSGMVPPELGQELLKQVGALTIWARRADSRMLVASIDNPPEVDVTTDLRDMSPPHEIIEAMGTLAARPGRILRVTARGMGGIVINMTIEENRLREAMWGFARNILLLSLLISLITAGLVYVSLLFMIVRPIKRLSANMAGFESEPENAARVIPTGDRSDEIGFAERSLARLEAKLADELRRSKKLAALGLMIAKISHDLRNVLSGAQLFSERIAELKNPSVQRLAPRLVDALRRAIDLCEGTLAYGADQKAALKPSRFKLAPLVAECWELALPVSRNAPAALINQVAPDAEITADRDQMARVFLNLMRNSLQAMAPQPQQPQAVEARITIAAQQGGELIVVQDNGPGVPASMWPRLFEPFSASSSRRGSGLGLAIVADILRAHDGDIRLAPSPGGARFEIRLPPH